MPIIQSENLSKKYLIRHETRGSYTALRDVISSGAQLAFKNIKQTLCRPFSKNASHQNSPSSEEFWALKDVSFEIKQGEVVGIIGRNGAGKSTLLKILSRITEPTTGRVRIKGRVASLLEVGTGFHPELTGRENIFLNGAILGMTKAEIKRKFDEIVAFAEIEKFLDTPVKRYSSGMYVRLAFAVAAHLEPEILLVDEVLAVGDAAFQKKCLGKMGEVAKEGRTVLFVSHNMNAIEDLCCRAILLNEGRIIQSNDNVRTIIKLYLFNENIDHKNNIWQNKADKYQNLPFEPVRFFIGDDMGNLVSMPTRNDENLWVYLEGRINICDPSLNIGYAVFNESGNCLYWSYHTDQPENQWPVLKTGMTLFKSKLPKRLLNEGSYKIEHILSLHYRKWLFEPGKSPVSIYWSIKGGLSDSPFWMVKRPGIIAPELKWTALKK